MNNASIHTNARRVSNRERMRVAMAAIDLERKARLTLLAVLAQSGGEVTVTQGTLDQVARNLSSITHEIVNSADNEYLIRLVEKDTTDGRFDTAGSDTGEARGTDHRLGNPDGVAVRPVYAVDGDTPGDAGTAEAVDRQP